MEPATAQPPDTHPGTGTPSQPDRSPHQPEHLVRDLPDTATAPGYTSTFGGRAEEAARVRREIAGYLDNCPVTDDMVLIADELAANCIVHTRSRGNSFHVRCELSPGLPGSRSKTWAARGGTANPMTGPTGWTSCKRSPAKTGGEPRPPAPGAASSGRGCHGDSAAARRRSQAPGRASAPSPPRTSAPCASATAGPRPRLGELMGWPSHLHRVRRRRPPRRPAAPLRHRGNRPSWPPSSASPPAQLTTRCATCGGQPPARVRLPGLRSRTRQRPPGHVRATRQGRHDQGGEPMSTRVDGATVTRHGHRPRHDQRRDRAPVTDRPRGPSAGHLAVQPQRRHRQPRRDRTRRRADRLHGRAAGTQQASAPPGTSPEPSNAACWSSSPTARSDPPDRPGAITAPRSRPPAAAVPRAAAW